MAERMPMINAAIVAHAWVNDKGGSLRIVPGVGNGFGYPVAGSIAIDNYDTVAENISCDLRGYPYAYLQLTEKYGRELIGLLLPEPKEVRVDKDVKSLIAWLIVTESHMAGFHPENDFTQIVRGSKDGKEDFLYDLERGEHINALMEQAHNFFKADGDYEADGLYVYAEDLLNLINSPDNQVDFTGRRGGI